MSRACAFQFGAIGLLSLLLARPLSGKETREMDIERSAREAHTFLTELCDDHGGRLTGSDANEAALQRLAEKLRECGLAPKFHRFEMTGWIREEDLVEMTAPFQRKLRAAALGYTQPADTGEADIVCWETVDDVRRSEPAPGKVALVAASVALPASELTENAVRRQLAGLLLINREGGGQLLARTGNHQGKPLPLPVCSITQEEGLRLLRLSRRDVGIRVRMKLRSHCTRIETANLVVRLAGDSPEKVVVGAHFDSWDLGQGAMDNGIGVAQLFALACALRDKPMRRTVELVWFNGEEQGLWGSRHEAGRLGEAPVVAMINLDMVGVPAAVNALGDDSLVPFLENWNQARGERRLPLGVQNINWFGSDHSPYQLAGVRAITFNAPLPGESSRYYHDFADTIDKVHAGLLVESTRVIADLVQALAADTTLAASCRSPVETEKIFIQYGLVGRLNAAGLRMP